MSTWTPTVDPYAPCPCGSGKKYKFCCLSKEREEARKKAEAEGGGAPHPDLKSAVTGPGHRADKSSSLSRAQEDRPAGTALRRSVSRGK